ncbi:MAG: hypothetical protein DME89_06930 [Verrucomicrobia bacterium]|nr:MAG: hypothetical protein DME89_06930 [Verrucomicrobiota bacterium]
MIPNHRFQFDKRRRYFIRTHNVTLSVVAMRVSNPNCSSFGINGRDTAPTPTGFAKSVCDDFPGFYLDFSRIVACH